MGRYTQASTETEKPATQEERGTGMATATQLTRASDGFVHGSWENGRGKEQSPYGIPIIDHCSNCALRGEGFFCSLSTEAKRDLDAIKHTSSYPEGAVVFVEGQAARGVYVICQGRAKLTTTSRDGKTLILRIARAGEVLGLHSTVSGAPHELTVETLQPCQLAFVAREDFLRFLKTHGDACLHAARDLSRDCQSAYNSIRSIGLSHSAMEKLARLLVQWADEGKVVDGMVKVKLALTHEEISQVIGISRETVTRLLGDLKRRQISELKGSTLVVRNKAELENLAGC
jgi:CRP/FNR family transcriptional regulator, cyclic AMP receptor protein